MCREVLLVMRAFNTEAYIPEIEWPRSIPAIQSIISNSSSRRLERRATITVHTGMPAGNHLSLALTQANFKEVQTIDKVRLTQKVKIEALCSALDVINKEVCETLTKNRKQAI